jgi:hypothetical protein
MMQALSYLALLAEAVAASQNSRLYEELQTGLA